MVNVELVGDLANDPGLRKFYEFDAEAATLHLCNIVRNYLGNESWRFRPNDWTNADIEAFSEGVTAYTQFCVRMMQKNPLLCLYDVEADGTPRLSPIDLGKALTQASARKYAMVMKNLVKEFWNKRVSAGQVRNFLTNTIKGRQDLRDANLIVVPNDGRVMYTRADGVAVPTVKYFIVDRDQLRRFRQPTNLMWRHKQKTRLEPRDALIAHCDDMEGWALADLNHEVEHLDPAHNFGDRKERKEEERYECDVLVNFQLALGGFNRDALYKDAYNVIKAGSLGPYHFLLRAYQLALKGPPEAPMRFLSLIGDHLRNDLGDAKLTAKYVGDECFKVFLNGAWQPRECTSVKKRLEDCLTGMRILDVGLRSGKAQTRLQFEQSTKAAVAPTMGKAPVDASARALQQAAVAALRGTENDGDDEPMIVDLGEVGEASSSADNRDKTPVTEVVGPSTPPGSPSAPIAPPPSPPAAERSNAAGKRPMAPVSEPAAAEKRPRTGAEEEEEEATAPPFELVKKTKAEYAATLTKLGVDKVCEKKYRKTGSEEPFTLCETTTGLTKDSTCHTCKNDRRGKAARSSHGKLGHGGCQWPGGCGKRSLGFGPNAGYHFCTNHQKLIKPKVEAVHGEGYRPPKGFDFSPFHPPPLRSAPSAAAEEAEEEEEEAWMDAFPTEYRTQPGLPQTPEAFAKQKDLDKRGYKAKYAKGKLGCCNALTDEGVYCDKMSKKTPGGRYRCEGCGGPENRGKCVASFVSDAGRAERTCKDTGPTNSSLGFAGQHYWSGRCCKQKCAETAAKAIQAYAEKGVAFPPGFVAHAQKDNITHDCSIDVFSL